MSKKYIIELEDEPTYMADGINYYKLADCPWVTIDDNVIKRLTPYEPGWHCNENEHCHVYGYPIQPLIAFAYACRKNGVGDQDLREFAQNVQFAFDVVTSDLKELYAQSFVRQKDAIAWEAAKSYLIPEIHLRQIADKEQIMVRLRNEWQG